MNLGEPNYILKANETTLEPVEGREYFLYLKDGICLITGIITVLSFVIEDFVLSDLSILSRVLLLVVSFILYFFWGIDKVNARTPIEISFYDDYMVFYRPKICYSKKLSRMEYSTIYYKDVTRCVLDTKLKRITIAGDYHFQWYNYNKNGNPTSKPTYDRFVKGTIDVIRTRMVPEIDFVSEIESHTPLKIKIKN